MANVAGGVLILLASLLMLVFAPMMGMMGGMMGMGISSGGGMTWMMVGFALVGLVAGGGVLLAAYQIHKHPDDAQSWGVAALVGGIVSLLTMGGFLLGAAASITGGILAMIAGNAPKAAQPPGTTP